MGELQTSRFQSERTHCSRGLLRLRPKLGLPLFRTPRKEAPFGIERFLPIPAFLISVKKIVSQLLEADVKWLFRCSAPTDVFKASDIQLFCIFTNASASVPI